MLWWVWDCEYEYSDWAGDSVEQKVAKHQLMDGDWEYPLVCIRSNGEIVVKEVRVSWTMQHLT